LISVIIPTYNREKYLKQCIESALYQSYPDKEVLVIDDGSTDNTEELCSRYDVIYIKTEHVNTAHAINVGIKNASGEWIKLLGSDDYLLPNALELFASQADSTNRIYYSDYYIDNKGELNKFICPEFPIERQFGELMRAFYGGCSFVSRKLFDRFGYFDESLPYAEDYDFWLRCVSQGVEMRHIPFYSTVFRIHEGQNTNVYGNSLDEGIKNKYTVS
jgi:teichuronic acid biosynthesis glycosyltransferase TuaG